MKQDVYWKAVGTEGLKSDKKLVFEEMGPSWSWRLSTG